jgi:hypothetical protein
LVDFLGAKTKKNRQQSEEMKARERRNRGPDKLMLYEREYSTKIDTLLLYLYLQVPSCIRCIRVYTCVHTMNQRILFSIFYASFDNIH